MLKGLIAAAGVLALTACATIMHGTSQDVGISSSPTGARVSVDNKPVGTTPMVASLSRKDNHVVRLEMDGYAPADLTLTRGVSGWVWGNIVFGGLVGLAVDAISGGLYKLTPDQLQATLANQHARVAPTRDGIFVVLVQGANAEWTRIGQLQRLRPAAESVGLQ
ncbi:MAG TPA: PEGA domain-containing protein [Gemmatimonadaceae bacterium]|nr:PEGA domain-containing protein [Gemmatimonadaceae bacterium]